MPCPISRNTGEAHGRGAAAFATLDRNTLRRTSQNTSGRARLRREEDLLAGGKALRLELQPREDSLAMGGEGASIEVRVEVLLPVDDEDGGLGPA
jgi:hypothetical protein